MALDNGLPDFVKTILNDLDRLEAVKNTTLFDEVDSTEFDEISALAALTMHCPVAQVTLLETERQWFLSSQGFPGRESPTSTSFCAHALTHTRQPLIVYNASTDERFSNNPFVSAPPSVRFYLGFPIEVSGQNVGTVCVYDFEPREEVTAEQLRVISQLADRAAEKIMTRAGLI